MSVTRRAFVKSTMALSCLAPALTFAASTQTQPNVITKTIPSSGEKISAIGMGTWITFNVGRDNEARNARCKILERFFKDGGQMIDSSPMYGSSEEVLGSCLKTLDHESKHMFSATKVWTRGKKDGIEQIEESHRLWNIPNFNLFQVHNLLDWKNHLDTLNKLKQDGRLQYLGITTSHGRRHSDFIKIMESEKLDFIQVTYNLEDREVENRILPLALEKGIAVIANRPFQGGNLFNRVNNLDLPDWVKEYNCENWAQVFLKFIISHPAITCAIPATSQLAHMIENMGALKGPLPDAKARKKMTSLIR